MIINKLKMPIAMAREIEDTNAKVEQQRGLIDYVAMMTDIEIPSEEETQEVEADE